MLLELMWYNSSVNYNPERTMRKSDTLSKAFKFEDSSPEDLEVEQNLTVHFLVAIPLYFRLLLQVSLPHKGKTARTVIKHFKVGDKSLT